MICALLCADLLSDLRRPDATAAREGRSDKARSLRHRVSVAGRTRPVTPLDVDISFDWVTDCADNRPGRPPERETGTACGESSGSISCRPAGSEMKQRTTTDLEQEDSGGADDAPNRSARKRAATAAQKLGERLIGLREADLATLALPERLLEALRVARTLRSRGGLARQRQYIGKLMREIDLEPVLELLEAGARSQALSAERFRRVEAWRDRLVAEGEPALAALGESRPLTPEQHARLADVLRRARRIDSAKAQRGSAARELFRSLRALFADADS